jgi:ribosomal-protein-alanine N-acetyltransferase
MNGSAAPAGVEPLDPDTELDAILDIDDESFVRPWTREMYEAEIRNPVTRIFVVKQTGTGIVGYCSTWFVPGELHVNNLAIRPAFRRQGLARRLLDHVLAQAQAAGCDRATLEVRRSNEAARRLYERAGFALAAVRRDYYTNPVEDALVLWRSPGPPEGRDKTVEGP